MTYSLSSFETMQHRLREKMPSQPRQRLGRSKPQYEEDGEFIFKDPTAFSDSVPGKFRAHVVEYVNAAKFPAIPAYKVGEVVYLDVLGQTQPAGPYVVSRVEENSMYRIKRQDNSQEFPQLVPEDKLRVPVGP
ncbi:hypothetical protein BDV97DRAFT_346226 [Delphinella strobiligena]|nr:hypothetical protein BDV97DRAFT_346226 [Delphinella strobiligena]